MKTIYIDATELKAVRVFAAKEDVRYYLKGVLVQATAKETRIVGTDGTIVGMFDQEQENEGVVFDEFIIPTNVIDALKPTDRLLVRVTVDAGQFRIQQYDDHAFQFKPIDGRFPDYTRIVLEKVSGEAAQFAGDLLDRIGKAQKIVDKKRTACIWHNGNDAALFGLLGAVRFIGVVTPLIHEPKTRKPLPVPDTSSFRRALNVEKAPTAQPDTADELL